ncbi:Vir E/ primase domain containing protein [Cellulophaga phage phi3:1]|nr:Vir E/ primase domain containing protein [Cellulophaga phage phi3:1]
MKKHKISYFENVGDTKPKSTNLDDWLSKTIDPPSELKSKVNQYRKLGFARLKRSIPCVTISATFKDRRHLDNIRKKNDFIVLDIDRYAKNKTSKCNLCVDLEKVKELFINVKSCYYVGYSVSSNGKDVQDGMYIIIRLKKGTSLLKAFKHFKKKLNRIGVNIDESCKDRTRLRFFSYDPNAYYNKKAEAYEIPKKRKIKAKPTENFNNKDDQQKVESIISVIEANGVDITSDYQDWYKIAGALYNSFGENGRDYFHRISRFYSGYKYKKADAKFDGCRNMNKVSLSSFFHITDKHGIRY